MLGKKDQFHVYKKFNWDSTLIEIEPQIWPITRKSLKNFEDVGNEIRKSFKIIFSQ